MPWSPLPRIAFAIAIHPFNPSTRDDLPLELGDELYIIESCSNSQWYRGYLVAPPSLLAGLTSSKGATLEARVFSGIFPAACVDIKEYLTTEVPILPEDAMGEDHHQQQHHHHQSARGSRELEDDDNEDDDDEYEYDQEGTVDGSTGFRYYSDGVEVNGHSLPAPPGGRRQKEEGKNVARTMSGKSRRRKQSVSTPTNRQSAMTLPPRRDRDRPRPAAPVPMLKVGDETSSFESEPLVDEIASCLREWHAANLHELLLNRQYPLLDEISGLIHTLDLSRRQLLHGVLTKSELVETRERTVWALVKGNKILSREIIVRDPASGRILTGDDSSVEITSLQSQMSLLDAPPAHANDGVALHHLLLEHKSFVGITTEPVTLVFYLATKANVPVSESFMIELGPGGVPTDGQLGRMQTLFTDLSSRDAAEDVFLVVRIYTTVTVVSPPGPQLQNKGNGFENTQGIKAAHTISTSTVSPSKEDKKLKGRVSVLFNPRPNPRPKTGEKGQRELGGVPEASPVMQRRHTNDENMSPITSPIMTDAPPIPALPRRFSFKKALGVGVLDVGKFVKQDQGTEQVMRIYVPTGSAGSTPTSTSAGSGGPTGEKNDASSDRSGSGGRKRDNSNSSNHDNEDWDRLIKDVIESKTGKYEKSARADRLHLYLRPFAAADADVLVKNTPTLLHNINCAQKIGFSGAPTRPRSDIYVTLDSAMLPRHGMLLHPKLGSCALPPASYFNSLQVSLEVRRPNGEQIKDCIFAASNTPALTVWKSVVVNREESWNETIKLVLDDEDVPNAHVFMTVSGVPNAPTALAWLPLWEQEAFLRDGDYSLLLHKYDDWTSSPISTSSGGGNGYLSQPWTPGDEGWAAALSMGGVASSIKWKNMKQEEVVAVLKKMVFVPEMEVVKLLKEVFDALFGVLVEYAKENEVEDLVFNALITVLGIVYDRRFHLEPMVDEYAEQHFDYPLSGPCLLRSFARLLQDPTNSEISRRLRSTFKVGRHVFRFIVKAREKQLAKEAGLGLNGNSGFIKELHGIFKLLENLMRNNAPMLVGSQTLAVQHFHLWLPELATTMMTREEILLLAIDFMDACADVKGKLILFKLVLIINYSRSQLFSMPEDRRALTLNTVRWLAPHWGKTDDVSRQWRDQVRLCCSVLACQVEELGEEVSEYIPKIIDSYCAIQATGRHERETFSLLFPRTYPFPTKSIPDRPVFDEALIELAAILAAVSSIPTGLHLDLSEEELAKFLMDDLQVHLSILSCEAFPESWLSVHIYQHRSTLRTLETLAGVLVDTFLPDPDDAERFNTELWQGFFNTLLTLVGSDALALETFPEQKRRAVWKVAGDVREQGADLLRRTWESIGWETSDEDRRRFGIEKMGGYQVQYVPGLVAPIVELCLSVHEGLRSVAVEVLQTMVVSEWTLSQDLSVIQAEMIDSLDRLFKSKRLTESITQKLFIADLIDLFQPLSRIPDDPLTVKVHSLLHTIDEFLDLLVAVHNTPLGEAYHIMDTLRLMEFLKDMRKEDMFIRYVHQLVIIQLDAQNYVEAGLSLKLHADLYAWDTNEKVPALVDPPFPEQSAFERREALFLEMIKHFEDGYSWENALDTYKELADQYENVLYDYAKLGKCHRAMAKIHEDILQGSGDGYNPRFFRVAYLGLGFPLGLRDRQFIVQGNHWEGLDAFTDRIQMQHPAAKIVSSVAIDSVEGQFIHITSVEPEHDIGHPVFQRCKVPPNTREFLLQRRPRSFSFAVPLSSSAAGRVGMWTEKTIYNTSERFPTILRRSEIVGVATCTVGPVENAIQAVMMKTKELSVVEKRFAEIKSGTGSAGGDGAGGVAQLSMILTGEVDGGVSSYRELLSDESVDPALRNALRMAMLDYVATLKKCLAVHGRLVGASGGGAQGGGKGLHEGLLRFFEKNYKRELAALAPPPIQIKPPISPGQWKAPLHSPSTPTPIPLKQHHKRPTPLSNPSHGMPLPFSLPQLQTSLLDADTMSVDSVSVDAVSVVGSTHRGRLASMIFGGGHGKGDGIVASVTATATTGVNMNGNGTYHYTKAPPIPEEPRSRTRSESVSTRNTSTSRGRDRSKSLRRRRPTADSLDELNDVESSPGGKGRPSTSSTRPPRSSGSGVVNSMERGVGSVKKRFSMLKLRGKGSKGDVKGNPKFGESVSEVGSVAEEE
ncbi:uncharacterized protein H6S33_002807 [Morchella sextelata]|uniref:uncharacterized protein n=1 Tax=Morchella sextelata TaxID=1174677 RepID=UPI001D042A58|nr:uncharacterized protein H6S33_002807 [Morchella sextelata]KAH0607773.1 hypothetical protein H6S33_002807 [Morchella sextelata]